MWHGWNMGIGSIELIILGLVMLLFWGGIIALAFFAIRALMRSGREQDEGGVRTYETETALDVLKKRYARGEISREEYLEMRRDLET